MQRMNTHMKRLPAAIVVLLAWTAMATPQWPASARTAEHRSIHGSRSTPNARDIYVTEFGADPTGVADSTAAIQAAVDAAANTTAPVPDVCGGKLTIHLEGGTYMISKPIQVGDAHGVAISGGTLFAATTFPPDDYLINGESPSLLSFDTMTIDARHIAGCLRLDMGLQIIVSDVLFYGFRTHGVLADNAAGMGHELLLDSCFFAEYNWNEPGFNDKSQKFGTGVEMRYPDSHILNSIFRCSLYGVVNKAGSNQFSQLHIYTTCDHSATPANMTVGFLDLGFQSRFLDGYIDNCELVIGHSDFASEVASTLFYGQAGIRVAPSALSQAVQGLRIVGNTFSCTQQACGYLYFDSSNGTVNFDQISGLRVVDNYFAAANQTKSSIVHATSVVNVSQAASPMTASVSVGDRLLFMPPAGISIVSTSARITASARVLSPAGQSFTATVMPPAAGDAAGDVTVQLTRLTGNADATVVVDVTVDIGDTSA